MKKCREKEINEKEKHWRGDDDDDDDDDDDGDDGAVLASVNCP